MLEILQNTENSNNNENKYLKRLLRSEFFKITDLKSEMKKSHYYQSGDEMSQIDFKEAPSPLILPEKPLEIEMTSKN